MGGFSAVLGNPPFLGDKKMRGVIGSQTREYIVSEKAHGARGGADLATYFLLQSYSCIAKHSYLGLVATNTLKQGDSKRIGLQNILDRKGSIKAAITDYHWGEGAQVVVDAFTICKGASKSNALLNGNKVEFISADLTNSANASMVPKLLISNSGKSFIGTYVLGKGFQVSITEAKELIAINPRNSEVVKPYLGGKDLNNSPLCEPTRFVIDFGEKTFNEAKSYPEPFSIIQLKVKPDRQRTKQNGDFVLGKKLVEKWWIHARTRPALYSAIRNKSRVLAIAQVSRTGKVAFVPSNQVLDSKLVVFALDDYASFAILNSSFHLIWAMKYCTTMRTDMSYTPRTIFETFPFPKENEDLSFIGEEIFVSRNKLMEKMEIGLTPLYKLVNDPECVNDDIVEYRNLYIKLDELICNLYGFEQKCLGHGHFITPQGVKWIPNHESQELILAELIKLNSLRSKDNTEIGG